MQRGSRRGALIPGRPGHDRGRNGDGSTGDDDGFLAFEAEVLPGLEPVARAEIESGSRPVDRVGSGEIGFRARNWAALHDLRRTVAVYRVLRFPVPRPKALLGDQHFRRLVAGIDEVRLRAPEPFHGFRFGAAGSESRVFARLAEALADATGLEHDPAEGELLIRVRPAVGGGGWEVLPRLAPRPLSARTWRVCNMVGGLNATLAAALHDVALGDARTGSGALAGHELRYWNPMCGSGTLLVEWRLAGHRGPASGCDLADDAVGCARENLAAAGVAASAEVGIGDATRVDVPDASFDVIATDLPWGDAVGSHASNRELYPAFLDEASRLLAPDGVLAALTHEVELFEGLLRTRPAFRLDRVVRAFHGGHWPRMYRLVREAAHGGG